MDTALTTAADGGALGARQRQLPTRLESYQVSLPQSLIPHGARAQDRGESVGAQRLQSLSLQTESVCMEDQPHGAHAIPDRPLSPGEADKVSEWNMAIHARDLPSQLTCHMSHPSAAHAGRSYQSRQGSPVLRPPAILNMSVPTYQSPWLSCPVVHSTPLSQPSSLHLGSSRLLQHEPHLSTLPHTTSTALKLQAAMTPTPGSRQENYTLTQSLPSTVTSAWAPSPLTTLNVSMLQPTPQASQAVSYASPQTSVTSGYPSNQPTTVMINNVQERVPPAAQLQYLPMQKTPVNLAPVQQYTPLPSAQPVWQYTPLPSAQPVQQHAPLFAQPAYQPPQIATAPYSAPQLPVAAGTVINPSPYSTATPLGTVYHPPSTIATQPLYQSPLPPQNQQLQLYQPVSAPSTQPAYQLVSPPAGFTLQQPPSAQQVQYSPQSQYTPLQVPYTTQSPRQPVPIPELPKLVHDSEREFADWWTRCDNVWPQEDLRFDSGQVTSHVLSPTCLPVPNLKVQSCGWPRRATIHRSRPLVCGGIVHLIGSVSSQSLQRVRPLLCCTSIRLWAKKRSWDDPNLPPDILQAWSSWERELPELANISLPRTYAPLELATDTTEYTLHVFCDSSEQAYGSRVAPKRQQSMPRLELCAALTGAQLSSLLHKELTLCIAQTFLWTDSTTTSPPPKIPDLTRFSSWRELIKATQQSLHGAAADPASLLCDLRDAEVHLLKISQADGFSVETRCLRAGKPVPPSSRLSTLAPELDPTLGLIRSPHSSLKRWMLSYTTLDQSLSLQTESVCMEDQPHGAHAIPDRPLSPGEADKPANMPYEPSIGGTRGAELSKQAGFSCPTATSYSQYERPNISITLAKLSSSSQHPSVTAIQPPSWII
ncbi:uncharacterized protein [Nerophis lumbriciformis]|uniref:uncharacterized protein n=1 Tax=Nerophis lumbriciformis TaxID=546530 RepID=UPI003BAB6BC9